YRNPAVPMALIQPSMPRFVQPPRPTVERSRQLSSLRPAPGKERSPLPHLDLVPNLANPRAVCLPWLQFGLFESGCPESSRGARLNRVVLTEACYDAANRRLRDRCLLRVGGGL